MQGGPERKQVEVQIPAGVQSGQRLRVGGLGQRNPSTGKVGDMLIDVVVAEHPVFKRDGADILVEVRVPFARAVLGGEVEVPTIEGDVLLALPAGTPSGHQLVMRGRGVPTGAGRGDQIVTVVHEVPRRLSQRQRELLEDFLKEEQKDARGRSWWSG